MELRFLFGILLFQPVLGFSVSLLLNCWAKDFAGQIILGVKDSRLVYYQIPDGYTIIDVNRIDNNNLFERFEAPNYQSGLHADYGIEYNYKMAEILGLHNGKEKLAERVAKGRTTYYATVNNQRCSFGTLDSLKFGHFYLIDGFASDGQPIFTFPTNVSRSDIDQTPQLSVHEKLDNAKKQLKIVQTEIDRQEKEKSVLSKEIGWLIETLTRVSMYPKKIKQFYRNQEALKSGDKTKASENQVISNIVKNKALLSYHTFADFNAQKSRFSEKLSQRQEQMAELSARLSKSYQKKVETETNIEVLRMAVEVSDTQEHYIEPRRKCLSGFTYNELFAKCIQFVPIDSSALHQHLLLGTCTKMNGSTALTVESKEQNDELGKIRQSVLGDHYIEILLGLNIPLYSPFSTENFRWADGSNATFRNWRTNCRNTHCPIRWDEKNGYNFLSFAIYGNVYNGAWSNVRDFNRKQSYIYHAACAMEPNIKMIDCPVGFHYSGVFNKCIQIVEIDEKARWVKEVFGMCTGESQPVTIKNEVENDELSRFIALKLGTGYQYGAVIGYHVPESEEWNVNKFRWVDGSNSKYTLFHPAFPASNEHGNAGNPFGRRLTAVYNNFTLTNFEGVGGLHNFYGRWLNLNVGEVLEYIRCIACAVEPNL
ncbi:hypothetical protein L596_026488 [Steinernema carpocapsae]|uniref:C-type lectin domain-containing protein n=1 Tax=Steinernema carpocapsae TaxID=34508 RepID=A0A4U5M2I7_STECR|nr:hypothetical protein L596_026488 [Steinernema carpocapsae]